MLAAIQHRTRTVLAAAALGLATLLVASPAIAGDFQPKRVAADAKWLAFINVDGILKSQLGKYFMEHGGELGIEIEDGDMQEIEAQFGVNPLKDVRSITVYGHGNPEAKPEFVALLDTTAAIDDAVAQFTGAGAADKGEGDDDDDDDDEAQDITTIDLNGQNVHVISDGEETTYFHVRPGATSNDRLVIVSMDREWMAKGLGVLEGKIASLSGAEKPGITFKPADGTLAFAVCSDLSWVEMDEDDDQPASAIIKGAKGVEVSYGESGADTFFNMRLDTGSKEDAQNLGDIARGLVAMARYAGGKEPELKPLMEPMRSLELKSEGSTIALSLTHNTQQFIDALKAMAAVGGAADEDEDEEKVEVKTEISVGKSENVKKDDND